MERRIIGRGLLAGALAGVLAFLYARVFIEPVISRAIDYESGRGDAHAAMTGMSELDMEVVTRSRAGRCSSAQLERVLGCRQALRRVPHLEALELAKIEAHAID